MRRLIRCLLLINILLALALPSSIVSADVGPKPSMEFNFIQEVSGPPLEIVSGILLQCGDPTCQEAEPLQELGPQRFTCEAQTCHAMAYGFREFNQLEITFSDGVVRKSNIFKEGQFNASYQVTIRQDDLLVEQKFNLLDLTTIPWLCLGGLCCAGVIMILLAVVVFRRTKKEN